MVFLNSIDEKIRLQVPTFTLAIIESIKGEGPAGRISSTQTWGRSTKHKIQ